METWECENSQLTNIVYVKHNVLVGYIQCVGCPFVSSGLNTELPRVRMEASAGRSMKMLLIIKATKLGWKHPQANMAEPLVMSSCH